MTTQTRQDPPKTYKKTSMRFVPLSLLAASALRFAVADDASIETGVDGGMTVTVSRHRSAVILTVLLDSWVDLFRSFHMMINSRTACPEKEKAARN